MEKRHRALLVDDPPIRGGSILARAKPETPGEGQHQTEQRSYVHVHTEVFQALSRNRLFMAFVNKTRKNIDEKRLSP